MIRVRDLGVLLTCSLAVMACAQAANDAGDDDDGSTSSTTGGAGGTTASTGGSGPSVTTGSGTGGAGATTTTTTGAGPSSTSTTTGVGGGSTGSGGSGGSGGGSGTCDAWSLGDLGGAGDNTGDIDVRYFEYRINASVLELRVAHSPFDPATATSVPGIRLEDEGTNVIDLHWTAGAPVFETSLNGVNFTPIPADPDLTIDVSDANVGGWITYTIPTSVMSTYLTSAVMPTEVYGHPFARNGTTVTDEITSATPNVRFSNRGQCNFILANNPEPSGDAVETDLGALSYNAENGLFRVRMDFYAPSAVPGEAQIYVWDQTPISGNAVVVFVIANGQLIIGARDELFGQLAAIPTPASCVTTPANLSAASDFFEIECGQADLELAIALSFGAFSFMNPSHRMGGLTWTAGTTPVADDAFPDGWTTYSQLDPITIP